MNHQDVVEATGEWTHPPFSGEVFDGKLWGRGTLDDKGGLYSMLQAAEELIEEGFVPACDIWFESSVTEETNGVGCDTISQELERRGMRFSMVLDEGGMMLDEPIAGAKGTFAMIGVGEKGYCDIKFTARSKGGHASTPPKDTPLVRLGKFMAEADKATIFPCKMTPAIQEMFERLAPAVDGPLGKVFANAGKFSKLLEKVMPTVSTDACALLRTTLAFTMAQGSQGYNVLPQEAWVIANMRYSHHQGRQASLDAVEKLAKKYDIEMEVLDPGFESKLSPYDTDGFHLLEDAVAAVFPGVTATPYVMNGASDCRFMSRVSDNCYRFVPHKISQSQLKTIHGIDENLDVSCLVPGIDWYKHLMSHVK